MRPTAQMKNMLTIPDSGHDFDVYVTIGSEDITVISSSDIRAAFEYSYYEWEMFTRGDTDSENYGYLVLCFSDYCHEMQMSFNSIFKALTAQYDPAANYSRDEQQSHKNTRTMLHGKTTTTTYNNYQTEISYASNVSADVTTFDDTNLRNKDKTSKGGKDTTTLNGSVSTADTGTDTTTDTGLLADNERKVTGLQRAAAAANIQQEIDMRVHNAFFDIVLQGFADRYLFLLA